MQQSPYLDHNHPGFCFNAVRYAVRTIPDALPGKLRVARLMMRPFHSHRPVRIKDRFGNALWCPSMVEPMATSLFASGVYEPDTLAAILDHLTPGGVYLDVGANVGTLALPVAALRPDARVICVEADPDIAAVLRRNVAENARSNVTVLEVLAGAKTNLAVPFFRAPRHKFGMGSIGAQFSATPIALAQRRLDDVLDEIGIPNIDIVKLDIEGAEFGALSGLIWHLKASPQPAVIFEFVDWAEARITGQAPGDAQKFMMSHGYRLFRIERGGAVSTALQSPMTAKAAMILAMPPKPVLRDVPEQIRE